MTKISVIGAGAWGTAIATSIAHASNNVTIWARELEVVDSINKSHKNHVFLPDIALPAGVTATANMDETAASDIIYLVAPSQFLRPTCEQLLKAGLKKETPLVICSKGIERGTLKLMSEVVEEVLPNPIAILTGPTFAAEVARNLPVFVTLACKNEQIAKEIAPTIESDYFKIRYSDDVIGAQIAGSVKNVIAIACGIVDGRELGENAKAALIVGGMREIEKLCEAKGGQPETIMRLCGIGDLILTCGSRQSRNNSLGYELGRGSTLEEITKKRKTVAEGVATSHSVTELAKKLGISMPICQAVNKILHEGANMSDVIEKLIQSY